MGSPLVSVIIPAYNHEKFIAEAVDSVLGQSCTDLELIVIDDGSKDTTGEIVQGYEDKRLTYIYQENQDAYNTINRGLDMARGDYIAILNSDDVYTVDRIEKLLVHQKDTGAECIITDVIPISDDSEEFTDPQFGWNVWHQKNRGWYYQCGDLYTTFLKGNLMVTTSNLFMTGNAARTVGRFSALRYLHDYDYIFRMMLAHPQAVSYMSEDKLLYYRIHSGNTLGEAAVKGRIQDREVIRKYMLARLPAEYHQYVEAGSDRLVELERELQEVRTILEPDPVNRGVRPAAKELAASLKIWVGKRLNRF